MNNTETNYRKRRRVLWTIALVVYACAAVTIILNDDLRITRFTMAQLKEKLEEHEKKKAEKQEQKKPREIPKKEIERAEKFYTERRLDKIKKELKKVEKDIEKIEEMTEKVKEEYYADLTPEEETVRRISALAEQIGQNPEIANHWQVRQVAEAGNALRKATPEQRPRVMEDLQKKNAAVKPHLAGIPNEPLRKRMEWRSNELGRLLNAALGGDFEAAQDLGQLVLEAPPLPATNNLQNWEQALAQREEILNLAYDQFKAYEGAAFDNQAVDTNLTERLQDAYVANADQLAAAALAAAAAVGAQMTQAYYSIGDTANQAQGNGEGFPQNGQPMGEGAQQQGNGDAQNALAQQGGGEGNPQGNGEGNPQNGGEGAPQGGGEGFAQTAEELGQRTAAWDKVANDAARLAGKAASMTRKAAGAATHSAQHFQTAQSINNAVGAARMGGNRQGGLDLSAAMASLGHGSSSMDDSSGVSHSIFTDQNEGDILVYDPAKRARINKRFDVSQIRAESIPGRRIYPNAKRKGWMYVDSYYIVGPWEAGNTPSSRLPVQEPERRIDLDAEYKGKIDPRTRLPLNLKWEYCQTDIVTIRPPNVMGNAYYYAYSELWCAEPTDMVLLIGTDDAGKIWVNDILIWEDEGLSPWRLDEGMVKVHFKKGWNKLLVRIHNGPSLCEFSICMTPAQ